jgi:hypothetical protein
MKVRAPLHFSDLMSAVRPMLRFAKIARIAFDLLVQAARRGGLAQW